MAPVVILVLFITILDDPDDYIILNEIHNSLLLFLLHGLLKLSQIKVLGGLWKLCHVCDLALVTLKLILSGTISIRVWYPYTCHHFFFLALFNLYRLGDGRHDRCCSRLWRALLNCILNVTIAWPIVSDLFGLVHAQRLCCYHFWDGLTLASFLDLIS